MLVLTLAANVAITQERDNITYTDLAPILTERCVMCHSGDGAPSGLKLDSYESILKGSLKGPVVKEGDPEGSELIRRLTGTSQPRMPMTGPPFLSDNQIAMFKQWLATGLNRGDTNSNEVLTKAPAPDSGATITYAHVAPVFAMHCTKCHADQGLMGSAPEGYRLTSYVATLETADRTRVVPGVPNASELIRRIRGQSQPRMPLDGPPYLNTEEIRLIENWVAQGARNAEGTHAEIPTGVDVRIHGTLDSLWQLDGLSLLVGVNTRIDKSPVPGDYVEVRGRLGAGAVIEVDRLRRR